MQTPTIDVKKTRFAGVGWTFEETLGDDCWQVIARKGTRIIVSRSFDRQAAWKGVFEKLEDSAASG
jgi:hypothetical protein